MNLFKWNYFTWSDRMVFLLLLFITAHFILAGEVTVVLTTAGGAKRTSSRLLVPRSKRGTLSVFLILLVIATTWALTIVFDILGPFNDGRGIDFHSLLCANW